MAATMRNLFSFFYTTTTTTTTTIDMTAVIIKKKNFWSPQTRESLEKQQKAKNTMEFVFPLFFSSSTSFVTSEEQFSSTTERETNRFLFYCLGVTMEQIFFVHSKRKVCKPIIARANFEWFTFRHNARRRITYVYFEILERETCPKWTRIVKNRIESSK